VILLDTHVVVYDVLEPKRLSQRARAVIAQSDAFAQGDPADRIIAATALAHRARLVSADARLRAMKGLQVIW